MVIFKENPYNPGHEEMIEMLNKNEVQLMLGRKLKVSYRENRDRNVL